MLVVEKAKALALKLNNPNRVLDSIPTAKPYEVRGVPIVITPHRLDEVKVLRNLGDQSAQPHPALLRLAWTVHTVRPPERNCCVPDAQPSWAGA